MVISVAATRTSNVETRTFVRAKRAAVCARVEDKTLAYDYTGVAMVLQIVIR